MAKKLKAIVRLQIHCRKGKSCPPNWPGPGWAWDQPDGVLQGIQRPHLQPDGRDSSRQKSPSIRMGLSPLFSKPRPLPCCLKKAAGVEKGSANPPREKVGKVTRAQVREIAELKMKDLNAIDIEGAMRQIEGTARNMGLEVVD